MNDEFEALPFAAGGMDGEMEEERGRPPPMRGMGRPAYRGGGRGQAPRSMAQTPPRGPGPGGRPGPRPSPRPGRWPRGPYWGPFYGWHPYGVMVSEPVGLPLAEPIEPVDLPGGDDGDDGGEQREMPPEVLAAVAAMTDPDKPAFTYVGTFMRSPSLLKDKVGGFYLITFPSGGRWKAYSGHTDDLKRRMQEHIREVTRLGLRAPRHKVYVSTSPLDLDGRRRVEKAFHTAMLRDYLGVLTNPRTELELAAY